MVDDSIAIFPLNRIPKVCPHCAQRVNANSPASIDHHRRPGHGIYVRMPRAWRRR
jgi:hypothetical protein